MSARRYFAVGADILWWHAEAEAGRATFVAHGRVYDYRLRLVGAPANPTATAFRSRGMVLWGSVYEKRDDLKLRADSGQDAVSVRAWDGTEHACTVRVSDETVDEAYAPKGHFAPLAAHARTVTDYPAGFRRFLEDLANGPAGLAADLLEVVRGTETDLRIGVAQIHPSDAARLGVTGLAAAVVYSGRVCPVKISLSEDIQRGACALNQNVRHLLGIEGRFPYGQRVAMYPLSEDLERLSPVQPRTLTLKLFRPARADSEKNIVVLSEKNLKLLGVEQGEYVELTAAMRGADSAYEMRRLTLRAFAGLESQVRRGNDTIDYPQPDEIYLDAAGRARLGLGREDQGAVVIVSASVRQLLLRRAVFYGATLFLSLTASRPLAAAVGDLLTPLIALGATSAIVVFDLRSRVHY